MNEAGSWPCLVMHHSSGGAVDTVGRDLGPGLRALATAWGAGDPEASLSIALPLFDSLDARRFQLLRADDFPEDPSGGGAQSHSFTQWTQCAVAQASVALTMALASWLLERGDRFVSRMPGLVEAAYPQWAARFPSGPWGDSYAGPGCLPIVARAAVFASLLVAEDFEPGLVRRALGPRSSAINLGVLEWLLPALGQDADSGVADPRTGAVATIHAIITQRGAGLGMIEDPVERCLAAAARGSLLEDAWFRRTGGPFAASAAARVSRGLAPQRRRELADRLEVLARSQVDRAYSDRLREFARRLSTAPGA